MTYDPTQVKGLLWLSNTTYLFVLDIRKTLYSPLAGLKTKTADLRSAVHGLLCMRQAMLAEDTEPPTLGFTVLCSTN